MEHKIKLCAVVAAALCIASACSNDADLEGGIGNDNGVEKMIVTASTSTRTSLQSDNTIQWSKSDAITMFCEEGNTAYKFTSTLEEDSAATSSFEGTEFTNSGGTYYALYPHDDANASAYSDEQLSFTTAATQSYTAGSFDPTAAPIVAKATDLSAMSFTHLFGFIKVNLKGVGTVKSITISSTGDAEMLYGDVTVDMSPDSETPDTPEVLSVTDGGTSITLDCGADGVVLDESTETSFIIAVAPTADASYTKISIELADQTVEQTEEVNIRRAGIMLRSYEITAPALPEEGPYTLAEISRFVSEGDTYPTDDTWVIDVDGGDTSVLAGDLQTLMARAYADNGSNLVDITLTTDVATTTLPDSAFLECTTLGALDVSAFTTIPTTFAKASSMTSLTLSRNALLIGQGAFNGCTALTEVLYDEETRTEEKGLVLTGGTFGSCTSLTTLDLSDAVTLGDSIATLCTNLTSIDLSSATTFGTDILSSCNNLLSIDLSAAGNFTFTSTTDGSKVFQGVYDRMAKVTLTLNDDKCGVADVTPATPLADLDNNTWLSRNDTDLTPLIFSSITYPSKPAEPIKASDFNSSGTYIPEGTEWEISVDTTTGITNLAATLKKIDYQVDITFVDGGGTYPTGGPFNGTTTLNKVTFSGYTTLSCTGLFKNSTVKEIDYGKSTYIPNEIMGSCNTIVKIIANSVTSIGASVFTGSDVTSIEEIQLGAATEITATNSWSGLDFSNCTLYLGDANYTDEMSSFLSNNTWSAIKNISALE